MSQWQTNFRPAKAPFFPWEFVTYLTHTLGLNECEAADLSDRAQCMMDAHLHKNQIIEGLWIRADVLLNNGSSMQPMWDRMKQLQGSFEPAPQI